MEYDKFEVKKSDTGVRVYVNGHEIKAVSDYSIDQTEPRIAKISLCFYADSVNVQFDREDLNNAAATGTE